ncbi:MAG: MFS transporter [Lachnospiraceae bacterium]|nr:MFS transporter [Lachnospiraceae bacterium]
MSAKEQKAGIHQAKIWQIGGFAFNNTATNLYAMLMNFIAYYLTGFVGVSVVIASTLITTMRIWDGVTDPFIGYAVDKTNTKFGKNRPFMVIGNAIMLIASGIMLHVTHRLPQGARFIFFIVTYMIYIVGYTFQCVVTKSAQTCLTNDPKQRPLFAIFDGIYNTVVFALIPIMVSTYLVPKHGGFTESFFHEAWLDVAVASVVLTCIAIFCISSKDRVEYFGIGKVVKVGFKDYWEVLKGNRAIQMLVVSASTDKLASTTMTNATTGILIYAIICGNYALSGAVAGYTSIPNMLFLMFGAGWIATRLGQKKAMMVGTWGGIIAVTLNILLFTFADPTTLCFPGMERFHGWTFFTVAFLGLYICSNGFSRIAGSIVIPMTADCADYEVYRSGKYVPGLMGTLFSFVDKLISSLSTTIIGLACAAIGFKDQLPTVDTPFSSDLKFVGLFCFFGLTLIGLICNVVAMKFYPLTKEKMEEIQDKIAEIKAQARAEV